MPSILKSALLVLGSLLVGFVVLEGAARVISPIATPGLPEGMVKPVNRNWILTPGFEGVMDNKVDYFDAYFKADERGVRITPGAPENAKRRLWLLGDSQTFGHGLNQDKTWAYHLQSQFLAQGWDVRVENYGVPGINIDQYFKRLLKIMPLTQPGDAVIVGVSWNDLTTTLYKPFYEEALGWHRERVSPADPSKKEGVEAAEQKRPDDDVETKTLQATEQVMADYDHSDFQVEPLKVLREIASDLQNNSVLAAMAVEAARGVYLKMRDSHPIADRIKGGVVDANMTLLGLMKEISEQKQVSLAALLLPHRVAFDPEVWAAYSQNGRFLPKGDVMGKLTEEACQGMDLTCMTIYQPLLAHIEEGVVFESDGHYNERGAEIIADFVYGQLDVLAPGLAAAKSEPGS